MCSYTEFVLLHLQKKPTVFHVYSKYSLSDRSICLLIKYLLSKFFSKNAPLLNTSEIWEVPKQKVEPLVKFNSKF